MTEIQNCLPRLPRGESAIKSAFQEHNRMALISFKPRPCRLQPRSSNHLTTLLYKCVLLSLLKDQQIVFQLLVKVRLFSGLQLTLIKEKLSKTTFRFLNFFILEYQQRPVFGLSEYS